MHPSCDEQFSLRSCKIIVQVLQISQLSPDIDREIFPSIPISKKGPPRIHSIPEHFFQFSQNTGYA